MVATVDKIVERIVLIDQLFQSLSQFIERIGLLRRAFRILGFFKSLFKICPGIGSVVFFIQRLGPRDQIGQCIITDGEINIDILILGNTFDLQGISTVCRSNLFREILTVDVDLNRFIAVGSDGQGIRTICCNRIQISNRSTAFAGIDRDIVLRSLRNRNGQSLRSDHELIKVRRVVGQLIRCGRAIRAANSRIPAVVIVNPDGVSSCIQGQGNSLLFKGIVREGVDEEITVRLILQVTEVNVLHIVFRQLADIDVTGQLRCIDIDTLRQTNNRLRRRIVASVVSGCLIIRRICNQNIVHMDGGITGGTLDSQFDHAIGICGGIGQIDLHFLNLVAVFRNLICQRHISDAIGRQGHSGIQSVVPDIAHADRNFIELGFHFKLVGNSSGINAVVVLVVGIAAGLVLVQTIHNLSILIATGILIRGVDRLVAFDNLVIGTVGSINHYVIGIDQFKAPLVAGLSVCAVYLIGHGVVGAEFLACVDSAGIVVTAVYKIVDVLRSDLDEVHMDGGITGGTLDSQFDHAIGICGGIGQIDLHFLNLVAVFRNLICQRHISDAIGRQGHSGIQSVVPDIAHADRNFIELGFHFKLVGNSSGINAVVVLVVGIAAGLVLVQTIHNLSILIATGILIRGVDRLVAFDNLVIGTVGSINHYVIGIDQFKAPLVAGLSVCAVYLIGHGVVGAEFLACVDSAGIVVAAVHKVDHIVEGAACFIGIIDDNKVRRVRLAVDLDNGILIHDLKALIVTIGHIVVGVEDLHLVFTCSRCIIGEFQIVSIFIRTFHTDHIHAVGSARALSNLDLIRHFSRNGILRFNCGGVILCIQRANTQIVQGDISSGIDINHVDTLLQVYCCSRICPSAGSTNTYRLNLVVQSGGSVANINIGSTGSGGLIVQGQIIQTAVLHNNGKADTSTAGHRIGQTSHIAATRVTGDGRTLRSGGTGIAAGSDQLIEVSQLGFIYGVESRSCLVVDTLIGNTQEVVADFVCIDSGNCFDNNRMGTCSQIVVSGFQTSHIFIQGVLHDDVLCSSAIQRNTLGNILGIVGETVQAVGTLTVTIHEVQTIQTICRNINGIRQCAIGGHCHNLVTGEIINGASRSRIDTGSAAKRRCFCLIDRTIASCQDQTCLCKALFRGLLHRNLVSIGSLCVVDCNGNGTICIDRVYTLDNYRRLFHCAMEAQIGGLFYCYIHPFGACECISGSDILQINLNGAGIAAKNRSRQILFFIHSRQTIEFRIVGIGLHFLQRASHVAVPLENPPCSVAFIGAGSQVVQVVGLMVVGQSTGHALVFQSGHPVDHFTGHTAGPDIQILVDADLRQLGDFRCSSNFKVIFPVNTIVPDVLEVLHMVVDSIQILGFQLVPADHIRQSVGIGTMLEVVQHTVTHTDFLAVLVNGCLLVRPPMIVVKLHAITAGVGANKGSLRVNRFDGIPINIPGLIEVIIIIAIIQFGRRTFIDRNIDDGFVNVNGSTNVIFRFFRCSVLFLPSVFPRHNGRADIILQNLCKLLRCGGNTKHTVIVADVHLDLPAAAFQERLGNIQRITIGMFRTDSALGDQNLGFQWHQRIGRRYILITDTIQETCGTMENLSIFHIGIYRVFA